jgi:hypothetical protein
MIKLDNLVKLFIVWAFFLQIALIVHFALRKPFFESYTLRYGWIIYALCIPAIIISIILLRGGKSWAFWTIRNLECSPAFLLLSVCAPLPLVLIGLFCTYEGIVNAIRAVADRPIHYPLSIPFVK